MRKILLVVLALTLAAVIMTACSPDPENPAVSPNVTEAVVQTQPTVSTEPAVETQLPVVAATTTQSAAPASPISGEELTNQRCTECHTMARVRNAAKTPEEWASTVKRMQGKGLKITAEEFDVILAFLSENYKK